MAMGIQGNFTQNTRVSPVAINTKTWSCIKKPLVV